jgi:hypothetical protein
VPDKEYTFDRNRQSMTVEHLARDHRMAPCGAGRCTTMTGFVMWNRSLAGVMGTKVPLLHGAPELQHPLPAEFTAFFRLCIDVENFASRDPGLDKPRR